MGRTENEHLIVKKEKGCTDSHGRIHTIPQLPAHPSSVLLLMNILLNSKDINESGNLKHFADGFIYISDYHGTLFVHLFLCR